MKTRMLLGVILALVLSLVFAGVALAASSTTDQILQDAQDGTLDGNWTSAQVAAALDYLQNSSLNNQYSDIQAVLSSYTTGGTTPGTGTSGGSLAFTGINVVLALGAGAGLIGGGVALRRRSRPTD